MTSGETQRDLGRAHWQRSVGAVTMGELVDDFYSDPPYELRDEGIEVHEWLTEQFRRHEGLPMVWARAHAISRCVFDHNTIDWPQNQLLEDQFATYAFMPTMTNAFGDGMRTQQTFPLNLAYKVSRAAKAERVPGFEIHNLADIAAAIQRPDFKALVNEAAFTKNGVWRAFANSINTEYYGEPELDFTFDEGQVAFSPRFAHYLRQEIREVNKQGQSHDTNVDTRTSSGCPVRHTQPRFTDSQTDAERLQMLRYYFGKPPTELLRERQQTVISDGLDRLGRSLTAAHHYLEDSE